MKPRRQLKIYRQADGTIPYLKWIDGLRDRFARQKVQARLNQIRLGNFGKTGSIGQGVHELKIDYGPGYRVYFAQDDDQAVVLLYGGDKNTQYADIKKAKQYWATCQKEKFYAGN